MDELTDREIFLLDELKSEESVYRKISKKYGADYQAMIFVKYHSLNDALSNYIESGTMTFTPYQKKHSPILWGSFAQSIGGPAAGAYVALSAAQDNADADAWNLQAKRNNAHISATQEIALTSLQKLISDLDELLNTHSEIMNIRNQWGQDRIAQATGLLEQIEKEKVHYWNPDSKDEQKRIISLLYLSSLFAGSNNVQKNALSKRTASSVTKIKKFWLLALLISIIALFIGIFLGCGFFSGEQPVNPLYLSYSTSEAARAKAEIAYRAYQDRLHTQLIWGAIVTCVGLTFTSVSIAILWEILWKHPAMPSQKTLLYCRYWDDTYNL